MFSPISVCSKLFLLSDPSCPQRSGACTGCIDGSVQHRVSLQNVPRLLSSATPPSPPKLPPSRIGLELSIEMEKVSPDSDRCTSPCSQNLGKIKGPGGVGSILAGGKG